MKSSILIVFLISFVSVFGQSVPNTTSFSLTNVQSAVGQNNLSSCFSSANPYYFDYEASILYPANSMLRFKAYGPKTLWIGGSSPGSFRENETDVLQFMPTSYGVSGATYGFTLSGTGITIGDISEMWVNGMQITPSLTGTFTMVAPFTSWTIPHGNGSSSSTGYPFASIWVFAKADNLTEGTEYIGMTTSSGGSLSWSISDTSYPTYFIPTLATGMLLGRTYNQIHTGGIISADGGAGVTARGVCYSTTQSSPSLTNSSYTMDGSGAGIYDSYMNSLTGNTYYYWRAFATNSAGTAYGYSDYASTLCSLSWSFSSGGTGDKIEIFINGTAVVSTGSTSSGTISCAIGDAVQVTVDPGNRDYSEASLQINAAAPQTDIQYTPSLSNLSGTVSGNVLISGSTHN
jgi:hypothetical protein